MILEPLIADYALWALLIVEGRTMTLILNGKHICKRYINTGCVGVQHGSGIQTPNMEQ